MSVVHLGAISHFFLLNSSELLENIGTVNVVDTKNEIYTIDSTPSDKPFVLGISYGYDKKITKDLLLQSKLGYYDV